MSEYTDIEIEQLNNQDALSASEITEAFELGINSNQTNNEPNYTP